jgi:hypothetical protein
MPMPHRGLELQMLLRQAVQLALHDYVDLPMQSTPARRVDISEAPH